MITSESSRNPSEIRLPARLRLLLSTLALTVSMVLAGCGEPKQMYDSPDISSARFDHFIVHIDEKFNFQDLLKCFEHLSDAELAEVINAIKAANPGLHHPDSFNTDLFIPNHLATQTCPGPSAD